MGMLTVRSRDAYRRQEGGRSPSTPAEMWADLVTPIAPFIDDVSRSMEARAEGFDPEIVEVARYALINQGKRLRPVLLGSCGRLFGGLTESHTLAATIVEMVHLATLVHDDVMDEADMRRSRPTVRSQWGNEVSVLLGDCFFAQALALASEFPTTTNLIRKMFKT